jgi:TRAP-type C4-dicarboxylate transport system permease small subunit
VLGGEIMKYCKRILENIPELITGAAFSTMMLVVFANVVLRYTMKKSLVWCEEVAAIGFIWTIFVGAAVCYKHKDLISVDVVVSLLSPRMKCIATIFIDSFIFLICLLLFCLSLQFSLSAWAKLSLSLRISYTFFDISSTVGFAFMVYYSIKHIVNDVLMLKKCKSMNGEI